MIHIEFFPARWIVASAMSLGGCFFMRTLVLIQEAILTSESSRALGGVRAVNTSRYEKDLDNLVNKGEHLHLAMQYECKREEPINEVKKSLRDKGQEFIQALPEFKDDYQPWYSESKSLIRQLLPDRLDDFTRYYEKPKARKEITVENYTVEDYLLGLTKRRGGSIMVGPDAAIPRFRQQLSLVKAIRERFRSSLFDIRQLAQADLFDSELDAAQELAKNKFGRAAGAVAGVVLERHLKEVCINHGLTFRKRAPQISDLNEALKGGNVIDIPQWRFIQHLGDLRNLCAHDKISEPKPGQVDDLLAGVAKVTKTIF